MYKVLDEDVKLRQAGKWLTTKAVLSGCSGGKRIDFVDADGNILKSQAYCRSKYSKVAKSSDGFEEESYENIPEKPSFSDHDFMVKMIAYNQRLRTLGLEENP
jgi:hypothetical protein